MRIAFVNQPKGFFELPPLGSIEIWQYEVARRLAEEHDVIVYSRRNPAQPAEEKIGGFRIRRLRLATDVALARRAMRRWNMLYTAFNAKRPPFASTSESLSYVLQIARDLREQKPDIVHVQNYSQFVPIIRFFNPGTHIVLHMHCDWLVDLDPVVVRPRLEAADQIVGCSNFITNRIRASFPQVADRCSTIHNGVDPDVFNAQGEALDEKPKVMFVGRITPEKGLHILLQALPHVLQKRPDVELELVGPPWQTPREYLVGLSRDVLVSELDRFYSPPPQPEYIRHLRRQLSIAASVQFVEAMPQTTLARRYREASVVVNPSLYESFGMTLLEGMASKTPVVASNVGGMPEVLDYGSCGFLVEPRDPQSLAHGILSALDRGEETCAMVERAKTRVDRHFTWSRVSDEVRTLYNAS